ncbi:MAG: VCBS domain-containing protein [Spiribacter sp.]|nr:VCBS domain-containing protein [Spiribacter sp.]
MSGRGRRRRGGFLNRAIVAGRRGVPLLAAGFLGAWLTRFFSQDDSPNRPESLQDQLLIAVSSASPVLLPDSPDHLVEQKSRFTIALEIPPKATSAEQTLAQAPVLPPVHKGIQDDDDEAIFWRDRAEPSPTIADNAPAVSNTVLPIIPDQPSARSNTDSDPDVKPTLDADNSPSLLDDDSNSAGRIVSITELNKHMGSVPSDDEDDDEGGWLFAGEGALAWFASAAASLLGGGGSSFVPGSGAASSSPDPSGLASSLSVSFLAGPFLEGGFTLSGTDSAGSELFTYAGQSIGSRIGANATLTGVDSALVMSGGEEVEVVTGIDIEFDDFSGRAFVEVREINGPAAEFVDESSGESVDLDTPLRGLGTLSTSETELIVVTPFTEAAIRMVQEANEFESFAFSDPDVRELLDLQFDSAAEQMSNIVGLDIAGIRPKAVNEPDFVNNAEGDQSSQYGLKLAALSELASEGAPNPAEGEIRSGRVNNALDDLLSNILPEVDEQDSSERTIKLVNNVAVAENQVALTEKLDDFIRSNPTVTLNTSEAPPGTDVLLPNVPSVDTIVTSADVPVISGSAIVRDTNNSKNESEDLSLTFIVRASDGDEALLASLVYEPNANDNDTPTLFSVDILTGDREIVENQSNIQFFSSEGELLDVPLVDQEIQWSLVLGESAENAGAFDVQLIIRDSGANAVRDQSSDELLLQADGLLYEKGGIDNQTFDSGDANTRLDITDFTVNFDELNSLEQSTAWIIDNDTQSASRVGTYGEVTLSPNESEGENGSSYTLSYQLDDDAHAVEGLQEGEQVSDDFVLPIDDSAQLTARFIVTGRNDVAEITGDNHGSATEGDTAVEISGGLQSVDVDNADTFIGETQSGEIGDLSITQSGDWTFTASAPLDELNADEQVSESFTVTTVDGTTETIVLTITGTNDAPVLETPLADQISDDGETVSLNITSHFSDADAAATLEYTAENLPTGLSINENTGVISGTIDESASEASPYTVSVQADDGTASVADTFLWSVESFDQADRPTLIVAPDLLIYEAGDEITLRITPSEVVSTLLPEDLGVSQALFENTAVSGGSGDFFEITTDVKDSISESTLVAFDIEANVVEDDDGNGNSASNTARVVILGNDAIFGDVIDEVLDDAFKRDDDQARTIEDGEFIFGDAGDDTILGYAGDDVLMGGQDDDAMLGGEGGDIFLAGPGDDVMVGGGGDDIYFLDAIRPDEGTQNIFIGNEGTDQVQLQQTANEYLINRVSALQIDQFNQLLDELEVSIASRIKMSQQIDATGPTNKLFVLFTDSEEDENSEVFTVDRAKTVTENSLSNVPDGTTSGDGLNLSGKYGTLTLGADGSYNYEVNKDNEHVSALDATKTLSESFVMEISNAEDGLFEQRLDVEIKRTDDSPTASGTLTDVSNVSGLEFDRDLPVLRIDRLTDSGRQTDFVQTEELVFADATLVFEQNGDNEFLTVKNSNDTLIHNGGGRPIQEIGDNYVLGKKADDRLIGGDGDDDLRGGEGDDVLVSLGGADALSGGSGDDTLIAFGSGTGAPAELTGGEGADTFVIAPQSISSVGVTIKDFDLVDDLINLDGIYTDNDGTAFNANDLFDTFILSPPDFGNGEVEIDLTEFFVEHPLQDDSYTPANGTLKIEFNAPISPEDFESSARVPYATDHPVGHSDWWNDLLDDGGLI